MRISVILLAVFVIVLIVLLLPGKKVEIPFADSLPDTPLLYVGLNGGADMAREVEQSELWKKLSGSESVREALKDSPGALRTAGRLLGFMGPLGPMLGEKSAVALYGMESRHGLTALSAVSSGDAQEEIFSRIKAEFQGAPAGTYSGMELYTFRVPALIGVEGAYARRGDTAFAALSFSDSMGALKEMIDLMDGKAKNSLAANSAFVSTVGMPAAGGGKQSGFFYVNVRAVPKAMGAMAAIGNRMYNSDLKSSRNLQRLLSARTPVLAVGGYFYRDRGITAGVHTQMSGNRTGAPAPGRLRVLGFIPRDAAALSATRIGNAADFLDTYRSLLPGDPILKIIAGQERRLGVDLEKDVLPWVGDEGAVFILGIQSAGLLPVVKGGMVLALKDRDRARKTLDGIVERITRPPAGQGGGARWAFLMPQQAAAEYKGRNIKTLVYPIPGFSPSFACVDDYLLLGLDRAQVEAMVDAGAGEGGSMLNAAAFSEMMRLAPEKLSAVGYMECARVITMAEGAANWWLAAKRLAAGPDNREEADKIAGIQSELPGISAALKVFKSLFWATSRRGNVLDQMVVIRTGD